MRHHLPEEVKKAIGRGVRLECWTLFWLTTIVVLMYLVTGSSQAMKTAWIEDCLSLVPAGLFILAARLETWRPTRRFPYGFNRVGSLAFFGAACALFVMGALLLYESLAALVRQEHPTIGTVSLFGHRVWLGWLMIPTLVYSVIPPIILGRKKRPLAHRINDKILFTDADMNAADWHTGAAGVLGILGVAFGHWWADSAAAAVISLSILKDGVRNSRVAIAELLDGAPRQVGGTDVSPDAERLKALVADDDRVAMHVRETGRYMRAVISPTDQHVLSMEKGSAVLGEDYWRIVEISVGADCPTDVMERLRRMNEEMPQTRKASPDKSGGT